MTTAVPTNPDLVDLRFTDWRNTKEVLLDSVPRSATVREVLAMAVRAMELPLRNAFRAAFQGRALNGTETLDDVGVTGTDEELTVLPEVSAGR